MKIRILLVLAYLCYSLGHAQSTLIPRTTGVVGDPEALVRQALKDGTVKPDQIPNRLKSEPSSLSSPEKSVTKFDTNQVESPLDPSEIWARQEQERLENSKLSLDTTRFETKLILNGPQISAHMQLEDTPGTYVLKAGDEVELSLWGQVERREVSTLDASGLAQFSGVGRVQLSGKTIASAERVLMQRFQPIQSGMAEGQVSMSLQVTRKAPIQVMVMGEAAKPGIYTVPAMTTAFQLLLKSKGPNAIGSVRNMMIRRNKTRIPIDLYELLLQGESSPKWQLQNGDVLYLPKAQSLVEMRGEVHRPGKYELKRSEGSDVLLKFAGGAKSNASRHGLMVERWGDMGRRELITVQGAAYVLGNQRVAMRDGDRITLSNSVEELENIVVIKGSVKYPGAYTWNAGLNISQLIQLAGGYNSEAFRRMAVLIQKDSLTGKSQLKSLDLAGKGLQAMLRPQDTLEIFNRDSMLTRFEVEISGAVRKPGKYAFVQGMTVKDLMLLAGGVLPEWELSRVQIERVNSNGSLQVSSVRLDTAVMDSVFELEPKDRVVFFRDPNWRNQEIVALSGAFMRPGRFSKSSVGERLGDFLRRLGELDSSAYIRGAHFFRKRDTTYYQIALDLNAALKGDTIHNIVLEDGDSLFIPRRQVSVTIQGEVLSAGDVLYREDFWIDDYIRRAGGFTHNADEERVVLTYASGEKISASRATRAPDPGSVIDVPTKPERPVGQTLQYAQIVTASVATLITAIAVYIGATK
jgi:protein involved in polysaccharide export with SLBB domain